MLRATFLGWQSWLIETRAARILVDPVLVDEVGRGAPSTRQSFLFYPPRVLRPDSFPAVDAVFVTHEHEDHFNIPTLARLDKTIPTFLSYRSSIAARDALDELGLARAPWHPGAAVRVGDLEVLAFSADHMATDVSDEWDTLGYLVRQSEGAGGFFTSVDLPVTAAMKEAVENERPQTLVFDAMTVGISPLGSFVEPGAPTGAPRFGEAPESEPEVLWHLRAGRRLSPLPGYTFTMEGGRLARFESATKYLSCPPRADWPPEVTWGQGEPLSPVTGRRDDLGAELPAMERELSDFAAYLYGRELFRRLYSIGAPVSGRRKPTVLLQLLARGEVYRSYEYQPSACAFARVENPPDPEDAYLGRIVCWAHDLLAVMRGEMEPRCIMPAYRESLSPPLDDFHFLLQELCPFLHPLRQPDKCLRQYRRQIAAEGAPAWSIRRRSR
jgi:hypothetical protein